MENIAIYSHDIDTHKIVDIILNKFDNTQVLIQGTKQDWTSIAIEVNKIIYLKIKRRARKKPDYQLVETNEPIIVNLMGMYNYVKSISAQNQKIKDKLLYKIATINTELGINMNQQFIDELKPLIFEITNELDGIIFTKRNSIFKTNGFYYKDGCLILNENGLSEVSDIEVLIEKKYFDKKQTN